MTAAACGSGRDACLMALRARPKNRSCAIILLGYHTVVTLRIAPRITRALEQGAAVVALESTVISHGLPAPANLELAHRLEQVVSNTGAVPATVGVIDGQLVVGLERGEIAQLASGAAKASLWNLAALAASGANAGTTVATTLHAAALAGIKVFATGGIGGVHHEPYDESADLMALGRYSVITVCSGPKSILDAAATLERLETWGVTVTGYRSDRLAGFFVPLTPHAVPSRCDAAEEVARMFAAHRTLHLSGGIVVSNPVSQGLTTDEMETLLASAQQAAEAARVRGKDATPFLLQHLAELSDGRTVTVNLRLLEENAALAARIAIALNPSPQPLTSTVGAAHE